MMMYESLALPKEMIMSFLRVHIPEAQSFAGWDTEALKQELP